MPLKIALVLLVTALCLGWVLWGIDPAVVAVSLGDFRWGYMVIVLGCYMSAHGLRVLRLRAILGRPVPFVRLLSILSIGYLAIHVVPLRMGEFVRPALLAEKEEIPFGAGLAAIFVERLIDMLMLLGMMLLVGFVVDLPEGRVVIEGIDVLLAGQRAVGTVVALGVVGLLALLVVGEPLLVLTDRLPLGGFLRRFREGIRTLARRPATLVGVLASSIVIWGITVLAVFVTLAAFPGLPASFGSALTVWAVTLAGMTVAPTPGFFGGFEAFCSASLVMLGSDGDRARTFAVLLHLGQFGFTVGTGLLFLVWEGLSLREVVGRSRVSATKEAA
ncbi:MAG: lysylphosphatidylglycerol synthase transmembrane domain-containing protein [Pseudomonadota bacterium]|nr:lysylphosphatidylglycerol synthase transmembrane domain-containing protein [Pseudomonadota bacterium]